MAFQSQYSSHKGILVFPVPSLSWSGQGPFATREWVVAQSTPHCDPLTPLGPPGGPVEVGGMKMNENEKWKIMATSLVAFRVSLALSDIPMPEGLGRRVHSPDIQSRGPGKLEKIREIVCITRTQTQSADLTTFECVCAFDSLRFVFVRIGIKDFYTSFEFW